MNKIFSTLFMVFLIVGIGYAQTTVNLPSVKDNTLFENGAGSLSNGVGPKMIAGKTNSSNVLRRALVQFDVSSIPANAIITSAKIKLQMVKTSSAAKMVSVHTTLADWGEGTSNDLTDGNGAPSTTNDATWIHRFHTATSWINAGGDYTAMASATLSVNAPGSYTWTSTGLAADVQNWVNGTATNNGWILIGDESTNKTTKHFATREATVVADRPDLEVTYTVPAPADIVMTEINYNPPESNTDSLEFIEFYNNGTTAVNLNGWSFTQGIVHTFPNITMNAGDYLVLAVDSVAMQNVYNISAYQWTGGGLTNGGEDIILVDANGTGVDTVDYDDNAPWATAPDAGGPSLELCDPNADNNNGASWIASFTPVGAGVIINGQVLLGSPGVANNCTPPIVTDPYPYETINTVTTNDVNGVPDSVNQDVELRGVVHSPDFDGNAGYSFALIDLTGGINVFNFNDLNGYVVTQGDSLHIKGSIGQYNGLTQISPDSIFVISQGNTLHEPTVEFELGENEESELVRYNGMWLVDATQWGTGSFNVDITNGADTMTMRIDADMNIATAPTGYFHVIGIGGQFDNSSPYDEGYQILPRSQADIMPIPALTNSLILTGIIDGPISGKPKSLELYVVNNIADLSIYGIGIANNGNGTDGQEYTFPAVSATAGDRIYVTNDTAVFSSFFGIYADFETGAITLNGNDAVQVFENFVTIDLFGELNSTNSSWVYLDTWTYRNCGTGPDGFTFQANNWSIGPINNFDNQTSNATSPVPMPIATYIPNCPQVLSANDDIVAVGYNMTATFMPLANDNIPNPLIGGAVVQNPSNGVSTLDLLTQTGTYTPNMNFCGADTAKYEICDLLGCDTALVVFNVACAPPVVTNDYPYQTIDVVTTNDANGVADSLGRKFELRGVVHSPDYDGNNGYSFSFIDLTGGINGFNFNDVNGYVVTQGDSLHIKGEIEQYNGLTEIVIDSVFVISQGNMLHEPAVLLPTVGEDEEMELIRYDGMWLADPAQWSPGGSGFNVDITNGFDTMTMRIDTDMNITTAPTGYFHVIGIGGQFDNSNPYDEGYQILPRSQSDIIPVTITNSLILTGLLDGNSSKKTMEIYVANNIADLSIYGFGIANNGGGTDGQEYAFPAVSANAGDFIYVSNDTAAFFAFTGKHAAYETGTISFNGDDAVQIYENGVTIDIYGLVDVHGDGQPWEYEDTWAYRDCSTGPDGTIFQLGDWSVAPKNNFDNQTSNATSPVPMPIGTYDPNCVQVLAANDDVVNVPYNTMVNFMPLGNDTYPNGLTNVAIVQNTVNGIIALDLITQSATYTPNNNYCGTDTATYEICDAGGCDTATIVFMIACPRPIYNIGQVNTSDADGVADSLNVLCELRGVVYGVDLRGGAFAPGLSFTVIDATGGMNIFNFNDVNGYVVTEGDSVHVLGKIIQFNGLTELELDSIHVAGTGATLKAPTVVTALGEDTESDLIQLASVTLVDPTQWTNAGNGFNVDITDGMNTMQMRIDNDCDLFGTTAPVGAFKLTGIGGQFDNSSPYTEGYQILPRYIADIELINNTNRVNLEGQIRFFPNPTREQLNIASDIDLTMIRVSNVLGQEVMTVNTPNKTSSIDVAHLTKGVYIITFVTENATWSAQFIKQ